MSEYNLYGCFRPLRVFNRHLGRLVVSNCGKCDYCTAIKSFDLSERVKREFISQGGNTALFVTLSYDNDHLPVYQYDGRRKKWLSNTGYASYPPVPGKDVDCYPSPVNYDIDNDGKLPLRTLGKRCCSRYKLRPAYAHLCYEDVQEYIALVRARLYNAVCRNGDNAIKRAYKDNNLTYDTLKIRYFVCGEYGPSSYRAHYHIIVWFNHQASDAQLASLSQILSTSWTLGAVDLQAVTSGGVSEYLASYVASVAHLPSVLQAKPVRPFAHFSQNPTVGTVNLSDTQVQEILFGGDACTRRYDEKKQSIIVVELPPSTLRRYFPRCKGFGIEDIRRLHYVYGYAYRYYKERGISHSPEEVDALRMRDIPYPVRLMSRETIRYFEAGKSLLLSDFAYPSDVRGGLWTWTRQDRYASLQCYRACVKYGITPEVYVAQLRSIYARRESRKLAKLYEWLNDDLARLPLAINRDPFLALDLESGKVCTSTVSSYFGVDLDEYLPISDVRRFSDDETGMTAHIARYVQLATERVKRKKINDYRKGLNVMRQFSVTQ